MQLMAAPWGNDNPGIVNLPAMVLIVMCALLLIRGASESATVNTVMVIIKLGVLAMFVLIAFTAFTTDHFADFWHAGFAGITAAASTIFFTFIGLDAVSTAGDEVKNPQKTMPRAIIAALIDRHQRLHSGGVRRARHTVRRGVRVRRTGRGRAVGRSWRTSCTARPGPAPILAAGAVISIFSVTLVVMYGQTRILFAMGRDGLLPSMFAKVNPRTMTPVNNTIIVAVITATLAGFVPLDYLWDLVSIGTLVAFISVSIGVIILRVREPDLPRGVQGAAVIPCTRPVGAGLRLRAATACHWYTWIVVRASGSPWCWPSTSSGAVTTAHSSTAATA